MKQNKEEVDHYHVSSKTWGGIRSIDIYLDHKLREARIIDSYNSENRITISADDWNKLISQIKKNQIGKIGA
ncbi:MAG: hypothetical protein HY805_10220 [Nitrospirae bacterium]|nr:hypothetical protein [Nitrospirota bacterium]